MFQGSAAVGLLWRDLAQQHRDVSFEIEEPSRSADQEQQMASQPCIAKLDNGRAVAFMQLPTGQVHEELLAAQVCHGQLLYIS